MTTPYRPYIPELLLTIQNGIDILAVEDPQSLAEIHLKLLILDDTIYNMIAEVREDDDVLE